MRHRAFVIAVGVILASGLVAQAGDAWARAGSGGSRGSRSYSAPVRPSPMSPTTPSSPSRSLSQPPPATPSAPRPSFFRGMMGAVAGFALGGLLGSLLFGGMGHGFGIGFFDILLVGGGLLLLWQFMKRRREAEQPGYATTTGSSGANTGAGGTAVVEMPAGASDGRGDFERGLSHIRQMDATFDPGAFAEEGRTQFGNVQSGIMMRDMGMMRDRLSPPMYAELQKQCDGLRATRRTNYIEKVVLEQAQVTEAWQEEGQDFVTVYFSGSMIDYTVEDGSGRVVDGSKEAQPFEEFWTFMRPVGPNKWKLTAIQTP